MATLLDQVAVYAVDIGTTNVQRGQDHGNVGWVRTRSGDDEIAGHDLDELWRLVVVDLDAGRPVAIGFECPLFIPLPPDSAGLCKQRDGDAGMPWNYGAGIYTMGIGLQEMTFVLDRVAATASTLPTATLVWAELAAGVAQLFVWEAFVTKAAKRNLPVEPHIDDARKAAEDFWDCIRSREDVDDASDVSEEVVVSLVGAAILRSGLSTDLGLLGAPCLVLRS